MRSAILLGARVVVGGYLAVHGAQKLFGAFGGPGLEKAAAGFERIGLAPGRQMAALAGATELGGGLLTAAGPGRLKIGPPLPRPLTTVAAAVGGLMAAGSLAKMARAARAAGAAHASSPVAEPSTAAQSPPATEDGTARARP